jgi:hypothetical protein
MAVLYLLCEGAQKGKAFSEVKVDGVKADSTAT